MFFSTKVGSLNGHRGLARDTGAPTNRELYESAVFANREMLSAGLRLLGESHRRGFIL